MRLRWAFVLLLVVDVYLVPVYEKDSLEALYNATSGDSWISKWDLKSDPCSTTPWFGISCGSNGLDSFIERINLQSNNLSGTLPDLKLPGLISL